MFVEAFHRVLKVVYFKHKQNRRVDILLTTLLKISRDKEFERIVKLEKGKPTHRMCEINKRHKSALHMCNTKILTIEADKEWRIQSQYEPTVYYTITRQTDVCECKLLCTQCMVCLHMLSCTCLDAVLHATVCKHIHLLAIMEKKNLTLRVKPEIYPTTQPMELDTVTSVYSQVNTCTLSQTDNIAPLNPFSGNFILSNFRFW